MNKSQFSSIANFFKPKDVNLDGRCPATKSDDDLYLISCVYHDEDYRGYRYDFLYVNAETLKLTTKTLTAPVSYSGDIISRNIKFNSKFDSYLRMRAQDAVKAGYLNQEWYDNYIEEHRK